MTADGGSSDVDRDKKHGVAIAQFGCCDCSEVRHSLLILAVVTDFSNRRPFVLDLTHD